MSAQTKKAPERAPSKEGDLYGWAVRESILLREGRLGEIDAVAIAEEIDEVGEEQYYRLESALRVPMQQLLKWGYQPAARSRSWSLSIREQRRRVVRQLRKNPAPASRLDEAFTDAYADARDEAGRETGLPLSTFPNEPPFAYSQIMERVIVWPGDED